MSSHQLLVLVLIQVIILLLPSIGLAKLFEKAGVPGWKAYIPFYNTWIMLQLAERPKHWVYWQIIPVVGWFISLGIYVEFVKVFGKFQLWEHAMAALLPIIYFPMIGFDPQVKFLGAGQARKHKKGTTREWIDAGVFAIVAATLIRTFGFGAYTIPTGSMEKTLLVNDFSVREQIQLWSADPEYAAVYSFCPQYHACHQWQFLCRMDQNPLYALVPQPGQTRRRGGL